MKMQCKSCGTELPKNAKICPKCGTANGKQKSNNIKVIAVAGLVIALIGGLLPFVQNTDVDQISDAYSFMNIDIPVMWYLYMAALVIGLILLAAKEEMLSIIPTVIAGIIFIVSFVGMNFRGYTKRNVYDLHSLTDLLSNGYDGYSYSIGMGFFIVIIGLIVGVAGCFFDVMKYFKKDLNVDTKYMSNSLNKNIWAKIYYYRWFYVMFLPVLIFVLLFNYWPMLGCRYAFTKYVIRSPYYVGITHFNTMFTNDVFFWDAFRNTLILSIVKLILNTGAAVIISLLLNEITNMAFKKTVQTIVYLPHFMSWVVVASIFRMILSTNGSGMVNTFLLNTGIINKAIFFLGDVKYWRGSFFFINVWKDTGWGTILFLATLSGISPDLYEAAQIDGANRWKRLLYITLPALANTIITVFILNLAKVMNLFESVFVLMNDAVVDVSNVLQTYVYRKTFGSGNSDYGYTTAVGLFKSFVGMILVLGCNYASKKVRGRGIV
jgi:putative aldouronate transport system permease protein